MTPPRRHVVPDDLELRDEPLDADREGHRLRRRGQDEGEQELRPVEGEDDDPGRQQPVRVSGSSTGGRRASELAPSTRAASSISSGISLQEALEHPDRRAAG